jgi:hypothetical protein
MTTLSIASAIGKFSGSKGDEACCTARFGYRRLHILLRREGVELNHKKLRRLYESMGTISLKQRRTNWRVAVAGKVPGELTGEQRRRFIETARKLGLDESEAGQERAFCKVGLRTSKMRQKKRSGL